MVISVNLLTYDGQNLQKLFTLVSSNLCSFQDTSILPEIESAIVHIGNPSSIRSNTLLSSRQLHVQS